MTKTKLVAVWHVEWSGSAGQPMIAVRASCAEAEDLSRMLTKVSLGLGQQGACITITGPHQHRVTA